MNEQETKYTSGPWRVEETGGAPMVVAGELGSVKERRTSTYREIAQVRYYFGSEDMSLVEANAKLIAAAPLMLEELQKMEWRYKMVDSVVRSCRSCGHSKERGHRDTCTLAAVIKVAIGE